MGITQPCHHISHCSRQLTNKTKNSKRSYHRRKLLQDCDQETTADSHRQASTCLMGLKRYRKNVVKRQYKAIHCTVRQKLSVITHIHKVKQVSSSSTEICRGKNHESAQYLLPKWATDLIENVQFLSDGHKHVGALGSTSKAETETVEMKSWCTDPLKTGSPSLVCPSLCPFLLKSTLLQKHPESPT